MMSIMNAKSEESYYDILQLIPRSKHTSPRTSRPTTHSTTAHGEQYYGWCLHKSYRPIAAGLNAACSHIPTKVRERITNHTNAVEQSHQESYSMVKKQDLLAAILGLVAVLVGVLVY